MATDTGSRELAALFSRDGVVCVRAALDATEVAEAACAIEKVLANPGPLAQVASSTDDPGLFAEDFCRWQERVDKLGERGAAVAA